MTTPESDPVDAAEQREPTRLPDDVPLETAEADAVEQVQPAGPDAGERLPDDVPLEATDADVVEQAQDVPLDEDEGRE
jgi:hypothetical protein